MRTGLTISAGVHVAALLASALTLVAKPYQAAPTDAMPVDIISSTDFSQLTAGSANAPPKQAPKPLVDNLGERNPAADPNAKIASKGVKAATDVTTPPQPKPEPPAKKQAQPKADPIAEALKKDEAAKRDQKKADAKTPPEKPLQPQVPSFDPRQVQALLDKRVPQRVAATGDAVNDTVALGAPTGKATQLSQSEIDAMRARLKQCWNPPAGVDRNSNLQVILNVRFKRDGTVIGNPDIVSGPASAMGPVMAESAKRALLTCQPFTMLKPEHYDLWKDMEINFDASEMLRG
jgi:colicin import membrane protein